MAKKRYNIEIIRNLFLQEGYTLLSTEYENIYQKLDFICPEGHEHNISWNCWKSGQRCGVCNRTTGKVTYDIVKQSFESEGYTLLSTEYVNKKKKLDFICSEGHEHNINWNNWQRGQRCGICHGNIKPEYEEIKQSFESEGYTLLSTEYVNSHAKLDFICPNGHEHNIAWYSWKNDRRCGKCDISKISKPEKEMVEFVKSICPYDFIENDRTTIYKEETDSFLELDIYIPSLNKAIEFNGDYWHSLTEAVKNDMIKENECDRLNIDLLVVKEIDWKTNRCVCEDNIKRFIYGN